MKHHYEEKSAVEIMEEEVPEDEEELNIMRERLNVLLTRCRRSAGRYLFWPVLRLKYKK